MSRRTNMVTKTPFEKALTKAIGEYRKLHPQISSERQKDIAWLEEVIHDLARVDVQKHMVILNYIKTLKVGLLGRSYLRDRIQTVLDKFSLESLIDELLKRHQAELNAQAMRTHALQTPATSPTQQELLSESHSLETQAIQQSREHLQTKAKQLIVLNKKLLAKYEALKRAYVALCKKHGEPYSFSSDTMSQLTTTVVSVVEEEEALDQEGAVSDQELKEVSGFNGQRLFKAVTDSHHAVAAHGKRLATS